MVVGRGVNPPWVPRIRNVMDTQYFDRYAESQESDTQLPDEQQKHFTDFWKTHMFITSKSFNLINQINLLQIFI